MIRFADVLELTINTIKVFYNLFVILWNTTVIIGIRLAILAVGFFIGNAISGLLLGIVFLFPALCIVSFVDDTALWLNLISFDSAKQSESE